MVYDLSVELDKVQRNGIETAPWLAYSYKPEVFFSIAYSDNSLYVKFYVSEKYAWAVSADPNGPVYNDSCVELFISFENEMEYYNFEFNCAGTCRLGFGIGRGNRRLVPKKIIRLIKQQSSIKPAGSADANIGWELTLMVPLEVFHYHHIKTLRGKRCRANFYKCGDKLPEPHFLAWNTVGTEYPDFHAPEYFGSIEFS